MAGGELLTLTEIADRLGVNHHAVHRWTKKAGWPEGREVERSGRLRTAYRWNEVETFCLENGLPKRIITDSI